MVSSGARSALPSPPWGIRRARQLSAGGGTPGIGLRVGSRRRARHGCTGRALQATHVRRGQAAHAGRLPTLRVSWGSRPPVGRERPNRAWTAGHGESLLPYRGRPATRPLASRGSTLRGSAFGCVQRAPGEGHSTGDGVDQPPTPSDRRAPIASSLGRVSIIRNLPSQDRKKRRLLRAEKESIDSAAAGMKTPIRPRGRDGTVNSSNL